MRIIRLCVGVLLLSGCGKPALPSNQVAESMVAEVEWIAGPRSDDSNALWLRFYSNKEPRTLVSPKEIAVSVRMSCCQTPAEFALEKRGEGEYWISPLKLWGGSGSQFDLVVSVFQNDQWDAVLETKITLP